jgi:hypothetical protein
LVLQVVALQAQALILAPSAKFWLMWTLEALLCLLDTTLSHKIN